MTDCITIDNVSTSIFLGILTSIISSIIIYFVEKYKTKIKRKKIYGKASGEYKGFGYTDINDDLTINEKPQTFASVNYIKDNLLEIKVKEYDDATNYLWKGMITMELENFGSIAWKYEIFNGEKLDSKKHKFGLKKLIINEDEKHIYLYLAEVSLSEGTKYGREIFKRLK